MFRRCGMMRVTLGWRVLGVHGPCPLSPPGRPRFGRRPSSRSDKKVEPTLFLARGIVNGSRSGDEVMARQELEPGDVDDPPCLVHSESNLDSSVEAVAND